MTEIICFDVETTGLDPARDVVIQFAAIVIEAATFESIEELELKVSFDVERASPEALSLNSFDPAVWAREAVHHSEARRKIHALIERHKTCRLISKRGKSYLVAQGMAYNASFDVDFLKALYRGDFMPMRFHVLDVLQWALLWTLTAPETERPEDLQLETMATHFGVEIAAHDALGDVRATVQVAKNLLIEIGQWPLKG